jgi:hypothetical protein
VEIVHCDFVGGFAENLGLTYVVYAELMGAIHAIEIVHRKLWYNLWISGGTGNFFLSKSMNSCSEKPKIVIV